MRRLIVAMMMVGCVAACATDPMPKDYTGPRATITDSYARQSADRVDFFYLDAVNGKDVENAKLQSRAASYGQGFNQRAVPFQRAVPAVDSTFKIVGETSYGAPIAAFLNKIYYIKGVLKFTPAENHRYVVMGELNDTHSILWLEDAATHEVIDHKFEVQGASTLELFQK